MNHEDLLKLEGVALDEAVALAEGLQIAENGSGGRWAMRVTEDASGMRKHTFVAYLGGENVPQYSPSTDPSQGQPIMERERIGTLPPIAGVFREWQAKVNGHPDEPDATGSTMLQAGMRAWVWHKARQGKA